MARVVSGFIVWIAIREMKDVIEKMDQRQIVDIADVQQMTLIEIGTGSIRSKVKRVDKSCIGTIGGFVNRVAVGIRDA